MYFKHLHLPSLILCLRLGLCCNKLHHLENVLDNQQFAWCSLQNFITTNEEVLIASPKHSNSAVWCSTDLLSWWRLVVRYWQCHILFSTQFLVQDVMDQVKCITIIFLWSHQRIIVLITLLKKWKYCFWQEGIYVFALSEYPNTVKAC